jgi:hypothetical protein
MKAIGVNTFIMEWSAKGKKSTLLQELHNNVCVTENSHTPYFS